MSEYTEAQAIIEVQDIQEIIVQEKDKQRELGIEGDKLDKGEANQPIVIATCNIDGVKTVNAVGKWEKKLLIYRK